MTQLEMVATHKWGVRKAGPQVGLRRTCQGPPCWVGRAGDRLVTSVFKVVKRRKSTHCDCSRTNALPLREVSTREQGVVVGVSGSSRHDDWLRGGPDGIGVFGGHQRKRLDEFAHKSNEDVEWASRGGADLFGTVPAHHERGS